MLHFKKDIQMSIALSIVNRLQYEIPYANLDFLILEDLGLDYNFRDTAINILIYIKKRR